MFSYTKPISSVVLSVLVIVAITGCVARKPVELVPRFKHPLFNTMGIQTITVLPVLDHRIEKKPSTDLNGAVHHSIERELKSRGYNVALISEQKYVADLSYGDIVSSPVSWVKSLGPENAQWVLLVVVDKLYRKITINVKGYADLSGYLYDKRNGEKVWAGVGHGEFKVGLFFAALADDSALELASLNLARSFPVNREQEK